MGSLIALALRFPTLVLAAAVVLLAWGARVLPNAPIDVFPEFAPPRLEIQTEAPGLSSEEIERLVSAPIEHAVTGTPWLSQVRSKSVEGLSSVLLFFESDTDWLRARQLVQERLGRAAPQLPQAALAPVLMPPLSSTSRVLKVGLRSSVLDPMELSALARWTIRPTLLSVPGVANVAVWGERDRQLQVLVDPDRLALVGVTLEEVLAAAGSATGRSGGGLVDTPNQRLAVSHVPAIENAEDLARVPVALRDGRPLRLGDAARVVEDSAPAIGDATVGDGPGLLLIVEKEPWGNTLAVTRGVDEALEALRPGLRGVSIDATIFRPAAFVERSIANLGRSLLVGVVLVAAMLALFLGEWRTMAVSLVAIPLSLVGAALVLHGLDATLNTMVLAGLAIALGEVVDDAIIDVENIVRRLRQAPASTDGASAFRVVLAASLEVRGPVVTASWIVALVVLPVFLLEGLAGSFFRPLALAYALAILTSLLVALTVTPALSLLLLRGGRLRDSEPLLVRALKARYRRALPRALDGGRRIFTGAVVVVLAAVAAVPLLGRELLPAFRESDFLMHWVGKPGTSLEAMRRITLRASRELLGVPGVESVGSHIGRAVAADEVVGANFGEIWIHTDEEAFDEAALARVHAIIEGTPGLFRDVLTYLRERVKEVLTGASASIVVRIYGPELVGLRELAARIEMTLAPVPGLSDLHVEPQVAVPRIEVRPRPEAGDLYGLDPGGLRRAVTTLVAGRKVGEIHRDPAILDVVVWGAPQVRDSLEALRALPIETPSGALVPLADVAEVRIGSAPNAIEREGASRRIDVYGNAAGRDLGSVVEDVRARLAGIELPHGYHVRLLGEWAERERAQARLLAGMAAAIAGMLLLLHAHFGELRPAILVVLGLPFAFVGGVLAVVIGGGAISLGSLVGFASVLGIASRNGLVLVSHYRHLERDEALPFGRELVLRGAEERLAPILMTASTTAFALLPIALAGGRPGHEIEQPMAVVILGGLVTSTALNLFVLPALYLAFARPGGGRLGYARPAHPEDTP